MIEIINIVALSFVIWQILQTILYSELSPRGIKEILIQPLRCWKCITFWTTIIITGNIYMSAWASIIAYIIECEKYLPLWKKLETWLNSGMKRK
jgi:hypothetical protein